jgi:nucleoside-diphosphate kinase
MVKPDGIENLGKIFTMISAGGFAVGKAKMARLTREQAALFYQEHEGRNFYE